MQRTNFLAPIVGLALLIGAIVVLPAETSFADEIVSTTPNAPFLSHHVVRAVSIDGNGLAYIGGDFHGLSNTYYYGAAAYEKATNSWSDLGEQATHFWASPGYVYDIERGPDGLMYVAGMFQAVGSNWVEARGVAAWDPQTRTWSSVGSRYAESSSFQVIDIEWHNSKLYAVGDLTIPGDVAHPGIAVWDGATWQPIGGGLDGKPVSLTFDGNDLYVTGDFANAYDSPGGAPIPVNGVAKWSGGSWSSLGAGVPSGVSPRTIEAHGGSVYLGGASTDPSYMNKVHVWHGGAWTSLNLAPMSEIKDFTWDLNGDLLVAGNFQIPERGISGLARWTGTVWQPVGGAYSGTVYEVASDGGNGYYVVGKFETQAGVHDFTHFTMLPRELTLSDTSLGSVDLGNTATKTVTLSLSGSSSAEIDSVSINEADVNIAPTITSTTCTPHHVLDSISPTCTIDLSWHPLREVTLDTTELTIDYVGSTPSQSALITGRTATAGPLQFLNLDFGPVKVGESKELTVQVGNLGLRDAPNVLIVDENAEAGVSHVGGTCQTVIPAGDACTLILRWAPTESGSLNSLLDISYERFLGETLGEGVFVQGQAYSDAVVDDPKPPQNLIPDSSAPNNPNATSIPGPVTKLKVTKNGKITWAPPASDGNLPITGYTVAVRKASAKKFHTVATVKKTTYTFRKLKPGKYVASVTSKNSMGGLLPVTVKFAISKPKR